MRTKHFEQIFELVKTVLDRNYEAELKRLGESDFRAALTVMNGIDLPSDMTADQRAEIQGWMQEEFLKYRNFFRIKNLKYVPSATSKREIEFKTSGFFGSKYTLRFHYETAVVADIQ